MTLGELVDSSARPITVILHSCYQPVSFVFILVTFPSGATLSRTLYFVLVEIKILQECVVRIGGGTP